LLKREITPYKIKKQYSYYHSNLTLKIIIESFNNDFKNHITEYGNENVRLGVCITLLYKI